MVTNKSSMVNQNYVVKFQAVSIFNLPFTNPCYWPVPTNYISCFSEIDLYDELSVVNDT